MAPDGRFGRFVGVPGAYRDITIERAEGNELVAADGTRYVDLIAGWCTVNAGYGRTEIIEAQQTALEEAAYVKPTYRDETVAALAERLAELTPEGLEKSFRVTSGSEAVDTAIKAARNATGNGRILANSNTWHGHVYGGLSLGHEEVGAPFRPLLPGISKIDAPVNPEQEWYMELDATLQEGKFAAYVTETVLTHQGVHVPSTEHYRQVREICNDNDVLLVLDEVANGFGRTGEMLAVDRYDIAPDIMTFAKGLTSGYAPIGAAVMRDDIGEELSAAGGTYSTFGWTRGAVAAAQATLDILESEELPQNAGQNGDLLREELEGTEGVAAVRQEGLLLGVELEEGTAAAVRDAGVEMGVLTGTSAVDDVLILSPPLNASEEHLKNGADRLRAAIQRTVQES